MCGFSPRETTTRSSDKLLLSSTTTQRQLCDNTPQFVGYKQLARNKWYLAVQRVCTKIIYLKQEKASQTMLPQSITISRDSLSLPIKRSYTKICENAILNLQVHTFLNLSSLISDKKNIWWRKVCWSSQDITSKKIIIRKLGIKISKQEHCFGKGQEQIRHSWQSWPTPQIISPRNSIFLV